MNDLKDTEFEQLKSRYVDIGCATYINNKFSDMCTAQERDNIFEFMHCLISVPQKYVREFWEFLSERTDLPSAVACIVFGGMNGFKGKLLNDKYLFLVNELKYSPKSLNMLKAVCEVCDIKLFEGKSIFGKPKVKLVFPSNLRELVRAWYDRLQNKIQPTAPHVPGDYDKLVEWWTNVNESDIANNELLFGAYQIMWFYNEVCNGGFDAFWDIAENQKWDLDKMQALFKKILQLKQVELFDKALQAHLNGQSCEKFNSEFDCNEMQNSVLPEIAKIVVGILNI